MKIKIVEAADQLGIGGTELALENFCRYLDKSKFDITVVGFREGGVRADILKSLGFPVVIANRDKRIWEAVLKTADVLHWHGSGHLDPEVFEPIRKLRPPLVIQTNVFGLFNNSTYYDLIDYDIYISKMCLLRRVREDGGKHDLFKHKRKILYYPVNLKRLEENLPSTKEITDCRKNLSIENLLTIGRIGRADDGKFNLLAIRMMPLLLRWFPNVKFVLVGPTAQMKKLVSKLRIQDKFLWIEPTSNLRTLLTYYKCIDVYLGVSSVGESFGMNLAEAMACGLPIVAVSTPDMDNAQIELVDNGKTGYVVEAYPRLVALAIRELLLDREKRQEMGKAAKVKVRTYSADLITRALENLIYQRLGIVKQGDLGTQEENLPLPWNENMAKDYLWRLAEVYAQPRLDDRLWVWIRNHGGRMKLKMSRLWQH